MCGRLAACGRFLPTPANTCPLGSRPLDTTFPFNPTFKQVGSDPTNSTWGGGVDPLEYDDVSPSTITLEYVNLTFEDDNLTSNIF